MTKVFLKEDRVLMNKAIFLDRDGTINVDKHYLCKPEQLEFLDGAVEALKLLKEKGYLLLVISNQSGVGRGYFGIEDVNLVNNHLNEMLIPFGVQLDAFYVCPHIEADHCNCRKPKTGMYEQAVKDFDLDLTECFMVGDKVSDILAASKLGTGYGLVLSGHDIDDEARLKYADHLYANLLEFAQNI